MRNSTFKPKSYKEKLAAAKKAQERARERVKVKPNKVTKKCTTIRRIGTQGKKNIAANRKIAELWELHSISYCDARLEGCLGNWPLQNAHRHRRNYYYDKPELLSDFNQVLRLCQSCHEKIDRRTPKAEQLTEELFNRLRE